MSRVYSGKPIGRSALVLAGAVLTAVLAGCGVLAPPDQDPGAATSTASASVAAGGGFGPVELASPIKFRLVEDVAAPPCPEGHLEGPQAEQCFALGEGFEVTRVENIDTGRARTTTGTPTGEVVVTMSFFDGDGQAFANLTAQAANSRFGRIAMVVNGELVSAPTVVEQIQGGQLQISGWDGAEEFVAQATGAGS